MWNGAAAIFYDTCIAIDIFECIFLILSWKAEQLLYLTQEYLRALDLFFFIICCFYNAIIEQPDLYVAITIEICTRTNMTRSLISIDFPALRTLYLVFLKRFFFVRSRCIELRCNVYFPLLFSFSYTCILMTPPPNFRFGPQFFVQIFWPQFIF